MAQPEQSHLPTRVRPAPLRAGDQVALLAPASVAAEDRIHRASQRLQQRGYRVKQYRDLQERRGYLAGTDESRCRELMTAFCDDEVQAVLPVRGGYGTMRLLELLDYDLLSRHPKLFVGFSDNTALHLAFQTRLGLVTFHGPHPADGPGAPNGWNPLSEGSYWRAIEPQGPFPPAGQDLVPPPFDRSQFTVIRPGVAEGALVGGNLATICALLGTPFEIQTAGKVLFLEDVDEPPYRIDRLLAQLKLAGKLADASGILLGQFTDCEPAAGKPSLTLDEVLSDYFDTLSIPVLAGFPAGHGGDNVTIPLMVPVRLDTDARSICQLEPACRSGPSAVVGDRP